MADNNQDFIQVLLEKIEKDDLPTNVFDVEGTDPLVLLGKMNEIIGQLENFQSSVNTSNSTANEALSKAEDAVDTSGQALSNANTALGTANQAIGTANTAIETANQSLETAQEAKDIADSANQNSGQAITTANEAKETAESALEQVTQGLGTKVYLNKVLQNRLDFTEDPQAQINDISTHIETFAPHTATQNHATSGVQVGWYQVANLKTNGNYDIKIKQAYNYNLPEAIQLAISINHRFFTNEPFASITQISGVKPTKFSLSKIRVRQGTDEGTTYLDVYNPDQLWNTTWVDITSDSQDVVVETNTPFQFIGTEDNPSGYKVSSLDLVTGFNTSYLRANTATISGTVSNLNTISQPVNSVVTYSFLGGCANAPITDSGMVTQMQVSTAYCTQLVIANDENASTWRRSYRDGTWTEWEKLTKLKSITFTSITDFYNFMQENIDSVKEVIITTGATSITGSQTNLSITSSASTFTNLSKVLVLNPNTEYRFNQFENSLSIITLGGAYEASLFMNNTNHVYVQLISSSISFLYNTTYMASDRYTISESYATGEYTDLTFKVYYFD